jgi:hypothetical protein
MQLKYSLLYDQRIKNKQTVFVSVRKPKSRLKNLGNVKVLLLVSLSFSHYMLYNV